MTYPVAYYYPEFIESRPDDPRVSAPSRPPLATSVTASKKFEHLAHERRQSTKLAIDVSTAQGLVDVDLTQSAQTAPRKSLDHDRAEKAAQNSIADRTIPQKAVHKPPIPVTNLDDNIELYSTPNDRSSMRNLSARTTELTKPPTRQVVDRHRSNEVI